MLSTLKIQSPRVFLAMAFIVLFCVASAAVIVGWMPDAGGLPFDITAID